MAAVPPSFPARYVNAVLNAGLTHAGGSKLVVDDREGSEHGAKVVVSSAHAFESVLLSSGALLRVVKLKGWLDASAIQKLGWLFERHLPACPAIRSVVLKAANFEDLPAARGALQQLATVLASHLPADATIVPAKKMSLPAGAASSSDLAAVLVARCRAATDAETAARSGLDPRTAKVKVKLGCLDGAAAGAQVPGVAQAVAQLSARQVLSVAMPSDAVCCAAATAGAVELRVAPLASVKVRGRVSDAAVSCVLDAVNAAGGIASVKLVRYVATGAQCAALVGGLVRASPPTIELACKREVAGPDGATSKAKHAWLLRRDGVGVERDVSSIVEALRTVDAG